ncbi:hypothetical protein AAFF_G00097330 [Aldrovandia affinis]|uniref:Uncharacterized protein n=1 Tax=Aldrovandia affinis TaxID=143900 RepID=A0AAD7RVM2_9TELE|nr:hypothetical protein AAFF_G00097330 [Aldrovandia affinis]
MCPRRGQEVNGSTRLQVTSSCLRSQPTLSHPTFRLCGCLMTSFSLTPCVRQHRSAAGVYLKACKIHARSQPCCERGPHARKDREVWCRQSAPATTGARPCQ